MYITHLKKIIVIFIKYSMGKCEIYTSNVMKLLGAASTDLFTVILSPWFMSNIFN